MNLPITLTIFDTKTHQLIYSASSTKKAVIQAAFASYDRSHRDLRGTWVGYVKVLYSYKRNTWNKAVFHNKSTLHKALDINTEPPIIKFLKKTGDIDVKYLETKAKS